MGVVFVRVHSIFEVSAALFRESINRLVIVGKNLEQNCSREDLRRVSTGKISTHTTTPLRINVTQGIIMSACLLMGVTPVTYPAGKS